MQSTVIFCMQKLSPAVVPHARKVRLYSLTQVNGGHSAQAGSQSGQIRHHWSAFGVSVSFPRNRTCIKPQCCLHCRKMPKTVKKAAEKCPESSIRTRVCNSILWGLSRQNSKFVIDDAQPLSFQVVMHSTLNTCMLALSRSSIFLTGISG